MQKEYEEFFARVGVLYQAKKIPKLKTLLRGAVTNISNLTNLLVRKSILKENLYDYSVNNERSFFLPEEKPFLENEKSRVIYDRLKAFVNALEFQASSLSGDMDSVTDLYLKNCQKILSYFDL